MLIEIRRESFYSTSNETVGNMCFEPLISAYQTGMRRRNDQDGQGFKKEFYASLTKGQRALFGFFTFYDHAVRSKEEFRHIAAQYLSDDIFLIVKKGAEFFQLESMQQLLSEIEQAFSKQNATQDAQLDDLHSRFSEIAPFALTNIGAFIKKNPDEFVVLL